MENRKLTLENKKEAKLEVFILADINSFNSNNYINISLIRLDNKKEEEQLEAFILTDTNYSKDNNYINVSYSYENFLYIPYEDNKSNSSEVFKILTEDCLFNNFSSDHNGQLNFNANAKYDASFVCSGNNLQASGMNWQNSCSENNLILSLKTDNTSENSVSVLCALDSNSSLLLVNSSRINSGAINSMFLDKNISLDDLFPFINNENNSLASITTNIYLCPLENLFDNASLTFLPNLSASSCVNSLSFEKDSSILSCTIFFSNASLATADQFITFSFCISSLNSSGMDKVMFDILNSKCNYVYSQVYKSVDLQQNEKSNGVFLK